MFAAYRSSRKGAAVAGPGQPQPASPGTGSSWSAVWVLVGAAVTAILIMLSMTGVLWVIKDRPAEVQLTPVILSAILVLTLSLGSLAVVFQRLGLSNGNAAMGLPEGSIRAVLALLLVLLFLVLSLYLFGRLQSQPPGRTLQGLTPAAADAIPVDQQLSRVQRPGTDGAPPTYDVTLTPIPNDTLDNFAMQLLTTMSTLVVAVAAFYFGATSVATAFDKGSKTTATTLEERARILSGPTDPRAAQSQTQTAVSTASAERAAPAAGSPPPRPSTDQPPGS